MNRARVALIGLAAALIIAGGVAWFSASDATAGDFSCDQVTTIPIEECEALIAFYDSTVGDNWNSNEGWLEPGSSPCDWQGVHCDAGTVDQLLFTDNGLSGTIPSEIGQLTGLWILGLADNDLTGSIPSQIAGLTNLQWLMLNTNHLSGNVPKSIGDLHSLHALVLHDNGLTGPLPASMIDLELTAFLFHETNLCEPEDPTFQSWLDGIGSLERTGVLCDSGYDSSTFTCATVSQITFEECAALVALFESTDGNNWNDNAGWLQSNDPCTWFGVWCTSGSQASVYMLSLHFNQLNGQIPQQLGDLGGLLFLSLNNNQLSGPIPEELGNLENLIDLHLPGNQLSGPIPETLGALENVAFISLWDNQLSGPIPTSFSELQRLEELELAENHLSGPIPAWMGGLSDLSLLALQDNDFAGPLPLSFSNLANLQVFAFQNTELCEPADPTFQNWLTGVDFVERNGLLCDEEDESPSSPKRPGNVFPSDGSSEISVMTSLVASEFEHSDSAAKHVATEWRITSQPGSYDSPVFALQEHSDLTAIGLTPGILEHNTNYYWQVRYRDDEQWSVWSEQTAFTTLPAPHAEFEVVADEPGDMSGVVLDASASSHPSRPLVAYIWDLTGDDVPDVTTADPEFHAWWISEGEHNVGLTVMDDRGGIAHTGSTVSAVEHNPDTYSALFGWNWRVWSGTTAELDEVDRWLRTIDELGWTHNFAWLSEGYSGRDVQTVLDQPVNPTVIAEFYDADELPDEVVIDDRYTYLDLLRALAFEEELVQSAYVRKPALQQQTASSLTFELAGAIGEDVLTFGAPAAVISLVTGYMHVPGWVALGIETLELSVSLQKFDLDAGSHHQVSYQDAFTRHIASYPLVDLRVDRAFQLDGKDEETKHAVRSEVIEHFMNLEERYGPQAEPGAGLDQEFRKNSREHVAQLIHFLLDEYSETLDDGHWFWIFSPGELRVFDDDGNITGLVDGDIKQQIENAWYFSEDKLVFIHAPESEYRIEIIGTDDGEYGIEVSSRVDGETTTVSASGIPTSPNTSHAYSIDWDAVATGELGLIVETSVEIDPDTINLNAGGRWITAYVELPEGFDVAEIDLDSLVLEFDDSGVAAERGEIQDEDVLMVKVDRMAVSEQLEPADEVELRVTGVIGDVRFAGTDTVRVIDRGGGPDGGRGHGS